MSNLVFKKLYLSISLNRFSVKILVVVNESLLLKTIELELLEQGYQVVATMDAQQAIHFLDTEKPDLVICNLMLSNVNDFQMLSSSKDITRKTPVIVLSQLDQQANKDFAGSFGSDGYLTIPFEMIDLSNMARSLL